MYESTLVLSGFGGKFWLQEMAVVVAAAPRKVGRQLPAWRELEAAQLNGEPLRQRAARLVLMGLKARRFSTEVPPSCAWSRSLLQKS